MGRTRDDLMDTMWDSVYCKEHDWTGPDSRFSCPQCGDEREQRLKADKSVARSILEPHDLDYLIDMVY